MKNSRSVTSTVRAPCCLTALSHLYTSKYSFVKTDPAHLLVQSKMCLGSLVLASFYLVPVSPPAEGGAFPSSSAHRVAVILQSFMVAASLHHIVGPPASHSAADDTVASTMACVAGSSWLRTARVQSAFSWPSCPAHGPSAGLGIGSVTVLGNLLLALPLPLSLPLEAAPTPLNKTGSGRPEIWDNK